MLFFKTTLVTFIKTLLYAPHYMKQQCTIIPPDFGVNPFFSIDANGRITAVNQAAEKITGISSSQLTNSSFADLFLESGKAAELLDLVFADGVACDYPLLLNMGNRGKGTQVIFNAFCDNDVPARSKKVFAIATLHGFQHNSETDSLQQIQKEITDYKYALDESSIVAITDQKGIIKYVNVNFCRISKYSKEELLGQDHRIINSGYHPKEFIRNLWITIANGEIWRGELKNKAKDGTYYWVDTTIVPFLNKEGKPYQYLAIRSDITSRKQVEETLEKSLKEVSDYKYALDESSIVAITDQKGIIKYANHNFCRISKFSYEELIGQDHRIINSGYHPKEFIRNLWITIANGKIWRGELKNRAKDGSHYWVDTTIVPFLDEQGKPYQYVAIRADITQRKHAEEEILILNEELEKRVKERTEEMESFSYSVSHDLRAPLRAVNGYARILEEDYKDLFDAEGKRLLGEVQQNAKKMGTLIDDLLAFSRLGRKEMEKSVIDMTRLTELAIKEVNQSTVHHAEIKVWPLLPVKADHTLLQNVMINLISNAIKYSGKKGKPFIEIRSKRGDGVITYSVSDNGVGFDMQYSSKLFGVFQRLHSADEFPGTGVGLAMAKRIINKHKGSIWAESKVGEGTVFYFAIPEN